jgi:hypothetical protein
MFISKVSLFFLLRIVDIEMREFHFIHVFVSFDKKLREESDEEKRKKFKNRLWLNIFEIKKNRKEGA